MCVFQGLERDEQRPRTRILAHVSVLRHGQLEPLQHRRIRLLDCFAPGGEFSFPIQRARSDKPRIYISPFLIITTFERSEFLFFLFFFSFCFPFATIDFLQLRSRDSVKLSSIQIFFSFSSTIKEKRSRMKNRRVRYGGQFAR